MARSPASSGSYVFLSYARADRQRALRIADRLEAAGIPVWIDRQSIGGGSRWSAEIACDSGHVADALALATKAVTSAQSVGELLGKDWHTGSWHKP